MTKNRFLFIFFIVCLIVNFYGNVIADDTTPTTLEAVITSGHSSNFSSLAFSPNGRLVLSGSQDKTMKLWDIQSGALIRTFRGRESFFSVAFSPDGRYALSGHFDGTLELWDIQSGAEVRTFKGHLGGKYALSGGERAKDLWDIVQSGAPDSAHSVAFSPDGRYALSGSSDKTIKLWDIQTGAEIRTFEGHSNWVTSVVISPDGRYVLSGSHDKTLKLWDIRSGAEIRTFKGHPAWVSSVAISPDGRYALSGGERTMILWDIQSGAKIKTFKEFSLFGSVAFSPDGKYALSVNRDTMILWDIQSGAKIKTFKEFSKKGSFHSFFAAAFSPDGRHALSGSNDFTLKLWDIQSGTLIRTFKGDTNYVRSVAFSPDGRYALSSAHNTLKLWDIQRGALIKKFKGHSGSVHSAAFSRDGGYVLSGSYDNTLKLWDIQRGAEIRTFKGHSGSVSSVAISPDGKHALSGSVDKTMKLWDIQSAALIRTFEVNSYNVHTVAFSPDGRYALSGAGTDLKLWDIQSGALIRTFEVNSYDVHSVAFSPNGRYALSGAGTDLKLWDIQTGAEVRTFKGHSKLVYSVAFRPDGRYALSGSWDKTLKLWDIQTGAEVRTFKGHSEIIFPIAFSPDGKHALSGSNDSTMKLWDVGTGANIETMMDFENGEWVSLTPDGYYNISPEGTSAINWVPKVGTDVFSFEQFEAKFKRPDIIRARVAGDHNAGKPAPEMTMPPRIEMPDHLSFKETAAKTYPLALTASAMKEVTSVRVFVNGRPVKEVAVNAREKKLSMEVLLFPGANRITAMAYDEKGFSSNPRYVDVASRRTDTVKPNLYVMAVGISSYPKLAAKWKLDYAHTDAQALIKAAQEQKGPLYGKVMSSLLTNETATVSSIKDAIDALAAINENDVALIYLAGHGAQAKDGTFYFLTTTGTFDDPRAGGVSWADMGERLSRIKGRVILLIDACHSGSVVTETVVPNDELARQFFAKGKSGIMAFSASKGRQSSLESPDIGGGFGIFTYALVQGLGPKAKEADTSGNGYVEFMELANYVSNYVDKATKGEQTPWLSRKELFGDLPIAKVK